MDSAKIGAKLRSYYPMLALLLYALQPLFYDIEWLFYANSFLIVGLFVLAIIGAVRVYAKDRKNFIEYATGNPRHNLYELMITIIGLIISYSVNLPGYSPYIWWMLLLLTAVAVLVSLPSLNTKDEREH